MLDREVYADWRLVGGMDHRAKYIYACMAQERLRYVNMRFSPRLVDPRYTLTFPSAYICTETQKIPARYKVRQFPARRMRAERVYEHGGTTANFCLSMLTSRSGVRKAQSSLMRSCS